VPMSSDPFDLAWSVAKSEGDDFDIDEYFLHRKGILDFIENQGELLSQRGKARRDRGLRRLGILPRLEQPLTEQPVVPVPDVRGEARGERGIEPPMEGRQMDEDSKDPREVPESKVREAKEETPEIQPENKVEPTAPKEELGMPQPPEGKPPKVEDIAVEAKDVTSKPPEADAPKPKKKRVTSKKVVSDVPPSPKKAKPKKPQKKTKTPPAKKKDDFKIPTMIKEGTDRDVVDRIVRLAEEGNEEAYRTLLNNSAELEDYFPEAHEKYEELRSMQKSFILKDPFANPFHNPNFLDVVNIKREMAQPMSPIIKSHPIQERVKPDIGFDTVEGDDLSLLPASIFMGQDNSVGTDDMSLLPTGWRNE